MERNAASCCMGTSAEWHDIWSYSKLAASVAPESRVEEGRNQAVGITGKPGRQKTARNK